MGELCQAEGALRLSGGGERGRAVEEGSGGGQGFVVVVEARRRQAGSG